MVLGTGTFAYADVIPDYTGIDETENLIGEEETPEQGGSLSEEARMAAVKVSDTSTLKTAINNASTDSNDPTTIEVTGSFELTEEIKIEGKFITITSGTGGPHTITRGSGATATLITADSEASLTLENIIIDGNGDNVSDQTGSLVGANQGIVTMKSGVVLKNNAKAGGGRAGGVDIYNRGTFIMTGGTISGNSTSSGGGGVRVGNGTFTMTGGEISGNTANNSSGGGVRVGNGTFTMTGGTISGNSADNGGGVYVQSGVTFNLSGEVSITGNIKTNGTTAGNVYLSSGRTITLTGALEDGASIGVTTADPPAEGSPVAIATAGNTTEGSTYTITASDRAKFEPDSSDYIVKRDTENNQLQLAVDTTPKIYVSGTGNDNTGSGTADAPYATLTKAFGEVDNVANAAGGVDNVIIYVAGDANEAKADLTMSKSTRATLSATTPVILTTTPGSTKNAMIQRGSGVTFNLIKVSSVAALTL